MARRARTAWPASRPPLPGGVHGGGVLDWIRLLGGSAKSEQAALDKAENFDLPWLGPAARAALPYGDDQIAPPAMGGGITLLAAECLAPPLPQAGL